MSAIQAISAMHYTSLANSAAYNMMSASNARMSMISSMGNPSFGSLEAISAMDTRLELDMITNSLQYKMAKAMMEQIKKQQKEDSERFSLFA